MYTPSSSHRGFSILMALGSIGVLMIIVVGMTSVFLSEMRLSRLQYDSILSSTQAEGVFEYAMLKIKNHRDGFADSMTFTSPDALLFSGASARTDKVSVSYTIRSNGTGEVFSGGLDQYTIVPLFSGKCSNLLDATSCDPSESPLTDQVKKIKNLSTSGNPSDLSWSIVGMNGNINVSISGSGNIDGSEKGVMRVRDITCIASDGSIAPPDSLNADGTCPNPFNEISGGEEIPYFYDTAGTTEQFLTNADTSDFKDMDIKNPFLLIFSTGPAADITLETDTPFTLPEMEIIAEAQKGEALQAVRFAEDKSRYYDALKFGVYNAE